MMMGIAPFSLCSDMGRLLGLRINVQVFPIRFFRCFRTTLLKLSLAAPGSKFFCHLLLHRADERSKARYDLSMHSS